MNHLCTYESRILFLCHWRKLNYCKTQISELSQRNTQLQADASRSLGQLTGATQRYEMLEANYKTLKSERDDYQKRSHAAMETATK